MSGIDDRVEELDVAGYAANIFRRTGIATGQTDGRAQLRIRGRDLRKHLICIVANYVDAREDQPLANGIDVRGGGEQRSDVPR